MNIINFLRYLNTSRIFCERIFKPSGVLQQIAKRSISDNLTNQDIKHKRMFQGELPGIIDNLMNSPKLSQLPEVRTWIKKVLDYNLAGGKHSRGLMTVQAYEMLEKPENITEDNVKLAKVLGWCTEIAIMFTCMGQHIDFTIAHYTNRNYSLFTTEQYETLVRYKTSYYTFRLPILLGLTLVEDVDKNMYAEIDEISFKLGHLFQIQDDYIDCYADEASTGKFGTDIQDGKCTWLAATALQLCNETQRDTFTKYYASKNTKDISMIKRLYDELQIGALYKEKENEIYTDIVRSVQQFSCPTAPNFFLRILDQIHKRKR